MLNDADVECFYAFLMALSLCLILMPSL
jgi:hypothetical protein